MLNFTFIICLLLSLVVAYFVMVKPLFLDKMQTYYRPDLKDNTFDESVAILETLAELETDFKMGKLSEGDFEALSLEYKRLYLEKKSNPA